MHNNYNDEDYLLPEIQEIQSLELGKTSYNKSEFLSQELSNHMAGIFLGEKNMEEFGSAQKSTPSNKWPYI